MSNTGLKKTKSGIPQSEIFNALKESAECGCGEVCDKCYSYKVMKNFNSTTGEYTYIAMWFVDGAPVYGTVAQAKAAQDAFTALRNA